MIDSKLQKNLMLSEEGSEIGGKDNFLAPSSEEEKMQNESYAAAAAAEGQKKLMLSEEGSEIGGKDNCLAPSSEEEKMQNESYAAAAEGQKSCSDVPKEKRRLAQPAKEAKRQKKPLDAGSEDWDKVYSYEEKRLKSLIEGESYGNWEKQNLSWEIENDLVPLPEEVSEEEEKGKGKTIRIRIYSEQERLENQKKQKEAFDKRLLELSTKVLTEEEKKLKESYIQKRENFRLGLSKETFFPFGPGWDLAYHTNLPKFTTVHLPQSEAARKVISLEDELEKLAAERRSTSEARRKVPEDLQRLCQNHQPTTTVISLEDEREKLAAEGRCFDGSYLTPYCNCNKKCYKFDTALKDDPPEYLPIWLAYCRQYRQSHCFDIDDYIGGRIGPLRPSQNFNGRADILMELANRAMQEYNEKECNVYNYKVMKIEKVNCCEATYTYWMTVKVSNLTLGSVIETFQIHAGLNRVTDKRYIFCCRPKEEVIIGLPSCEFCFGLLRGETKEP